MSHELRRFLAATAFACLTSVAVACGGDGDNDGRYDPGPDPIDCEPADCLDPNRPDAGGTMSCRELGFEEGKQCYAFSESERFCCTPSEFP